MVLVGPPEVKIVEEMFSNCVPIVNLRVGGQVICTTAGREKVAEVDLGQTVWQIGSRLFLLFLARRGEPTCGIRAAATGV